MKLKSDIFDFALWLVFDGGNDDDDFNIKRAYMNIYRYILVRWLIRICPCKYSNIFNNLRVLHFVVVGINIEYANRTTVCIVFVVLSKVKRIASANKRSTATEKKRENIN